MRFFFQGVRQTKISSSSIALIRSRINMSIVDKLTKQQIIDFKEAFSLFVTDDEGTIDAEGLG